MRCMIIGVLFAVFASATGEAGMLITSPKRQRETLKGVEGIAISFSAASPEALGLINNSNALEALLKNRLRESGIFLVEEQVTSQRQAFRTALVHVGLSCADLFKCDSMRAEIGVQQYVALARDSSAVFMSPTFEDTVYHSAKIKSSLEAERIARELILDAANVFIDAYYGANPKPPKMEK